MSIMQNVVKMANLRRLAKTHLIFLFLLCCISFLLSEENSMNDAREVNKEMQESDTKEENNINNSIEEDQKGEVANEEQSVEVLENEYILIPSIGYSSLGASVGLDFMYRKPNGFALLTNLNFSVPTVNFGGAIFSTELYIGYSLKKNKFYTSFLLGTWLGGGSAFVEFVNHPLRKAYMNGDLRVIPSLLFTFALRGDFTYFFNDKLGFNISHAHGMGVFTHAVAMDRRRYPSYLNHYYIFMLKVALAIRV